MQTDVLDCVWRNVDEIRIGIDSDDIWLEETVVWDIYPPVEFEISPDCFVPEMVTVDDDQRIVIPTLPIRSTAR